MPARDLAFLAAALLLGAVSTEVADDWAAASPFAEAWFFSLVPVMLDIVKPSTAWVWATLTYAVQYLALFGALYASWEILGSAKPACALCASGSQAFNRPERRA